MRVNIGCGKTPTSGWKNFDNSFSLWFSKMQFLAKLLYKIGVLGDAQYQFIQFARVNSIIYGDATKGLPLPSESCDVVYSSHMLEHLDRSGASEFLKEVYRLLCPGGIVRISVPDLEKQIERYNELGDADVFVESTHMCVPQPASFSEKLKFLIVGPRHHQWMYDGRSLAKLLHEHGFIDVDVIPAGETNIPEPGQLDLFERSSESVYVEAKKPSI